MKRTLRVVRRDEHFHDTYQRTLRDVEERLSILVTTNLRFGDWISIFGNETMTTALLDRLTGKGHILEFIGESYRFRQRLRQEEQQPLTAQAETG